MSELLKINVNDHTELKNGLTYLSWAWAWSEVLKLDPQATWEAVEFNGLPFAILPDSTAMVKTIVTIKEHAKSCWLPVLNHKNQSIEKPNAFQVNTALVRCLTKNIAMHGLGLYIYAGEDLPEIDWDHVNELIAAMVEASQEGKDMEAVKIWYADKTFAPNEVKEYAWGQLRDYSALRAAIKANKPELKAA